MVTTTAAERPILMLASALAVRSPSAPPLLKGPSQPNARTGKERWPALPKGASVACR